MYNHLQALHISVSTLQEALSCFLNVHTTTKMDRTEPDNIVSAKSYYILQRHQIQYYRWNLNFFKQCLLK